MRRMIGSTVLSIALVPGFAALTTEAEQACAAAAGEGAQLSLALGTPTWTTADAVYVTRGATCIRASVARSSRPDLAGASAVAEALSAV